jgi:hypothetical protein
MKSYKSTDPKEIQLKAIPLSVISHLAKANTTETQKSTAQFIIGAFFFANRSCKYAQVKNPENKKTKTIIIKNIAFYKDDAAIAHTSKSTPALAFADRVSITFVT